MSVAAIVQAARATLTRTLFTRTCIRQDAATNWTPTGTFACHYEEASPQTTGLTSFEGGNAGYGVNVYLDDAATLNSQDRIVVDGMTLEVQRVAVLGEADGAKRAFCVKRGA
jgi:hypothetical protein